MYGAVCRREDKRPAERIPGLSRRSFTLVTDGRSVCPVAALLVHNRSSALSSSRPQVLPVPHSPEHPAGLAYASRGGLPCSSGRQQLRAQPRRGRAVDLAPPVPVPALRTRELAAFAPTPSPTCWLLSQCFSSRPSAAPPDLLTCAPQLLLSSPHARERSPLATSAVRLNTAR